MAVTEPTTEHARRRRRRENQVLDALAAGHTYAQSAQIAGVSVRTIYRWLEDPLFRAEVGDRKREVVQRTAASLGSAAVSAVATLTELLAERDPWVRHRTGVALLEMALRYTESAELVDRVAALEERVREERAAREPA